MNKHFERELKKLSGDMLVRYADFVAYSFWNLQGNWMQLVSTRHGSEVAAEYDMAVWDRNSKVQAWKLNALFEMETAFHHLAVSGGHLQPISAGNQGFEKIGPKPTVHLPIITIIPTAFDGIV